MLPLPAAPASPARRPYWVTALQYDILRHIHSGKPDKQYPESDQPRRVVSYMKTKHGLNRIQMVVAFERGLFRIRRPLVTRRDDRTLNTFEQYLARRSGS